MGHLVSLCQAKLLKGGGQTVTLDRIQNTLFLCTVFICIEVLLSQNVFMNKVTDSSQQLCETGTLFPCEDEEAEFREVRELPQTHRASQP